MNTFKLACILEIAYRAPENVLSLLRVLIQFSLQTKQKHDCLFTYVVEPQRNEVSFFFFWQNWDCNQTGYCSVLLGVWLLKEPHVGIFLEIPVLEMLLNDKYFPCLLIGCYLILSDIIDGSIYTSEWELGSVHGSTFRLQSYCCEG